MEEHGGGFQVERFAFFSFFLGKLIRCKDAYISLGSPNMPVIPSFMALADCN